MAEDDGGLFSGFLNADDGSTVPGTSIVVVDPNDPVSWLRVFGSAIGGIMATFAAGIAQIPQSVAGAVSAIVQGLLSILFGRLSTSSAGTIDGSASNIRIPGLFDVVFGGLAAAANNVWSAPLDRYGILGLPVSVFIVLATTYIVVQGLRKAYAVFLGEEVL